MDKKHIFYDNTKKQFLENDIFHKENLSILKQKAGTYRLICLDLDHTLLRNDGTISDFSRTILEKAARNHIHVVIASGRPFQALPPEVLSLSGLQYIITSNGAVLQKLHPFSRMRHFCLSSESLMSLVRDFKKYFPIEVFMDGQGYAEERYIENPVAFGAKPSHIPYIRSTRLPVNDMEAFTLKHGGEIESLDIIVPDDKVNRYLRDTIALSYPEVHVTSSTTHLVEISSKDAGKENQLKYLAQHLHISMQQCISFGDGDNDADMLQACGLGIAMENASEGAKKAAAFVTSSNEADGVAAALNLILFS